MNCRSETTKVRVKRRTRLLSENGRIGCVDNLVQTNSESNTEMIH